MHKLLQRTLRLLASVAGVAVITAVAYRLTPVNATTVGFAYLLIVLIVASTWGFLEALAASITATILFNLYFLPPTGQLTIADPQNWIALFSFLATSLIASRLSTIAKSRAADAMQRQQDVEHLYTFSRAILLIDDSEPFAKQLANKLAEIFALNAVILYDRRSDEMYRAGPADFDGMKEQLREAALQSAFFTDTSRKRVMTVVRLGSEPIASLAIQGGPITDSVLQGISNLIAIGLERAKAQDLAQQVAAARQTELLRTTLIDAMAHEFKTPLTSIKAATTSLLSAPEQPEANKTELLKVADEEADHLKELIENALEMARLDAAHIDVQTEVSSLEEAIRDVVATMQTAIDSRPIQIVSDPRMPPIAFDRRLLKLAVKQILDNALKYSPPGTPVTLRIQNANNGSATLEIVDRGTGISPQEQQRIFQRFYRSPSMHQQIPGTGLGLSIAQRIVQAHGGDLTVISNPGETSFRMILPMEHPGEAK